MQALTMAGFALCACVEFAPPAETAHDDIATPPPLSAPAPSVSTAAPTLVAAMPPTPAAAPGAPDNGAVSTERLARTRGGSDTVTTEATLSGVVSGNAAMNVSTGSNLIQSGSFANASGIPIVIQNSGANVLIQNATVVNLQLK